MNLPQKLETKRHKSWKQNATKVGNKTPQKLETNVNKEKQMPLRLPDLKIVITGTQYGYRREDGVFVIPIGCLKD